MISQSVQPHNDTYLLFNPSHVAEDPAGGVARLIAAHTCRDILGNLLFEMKLDFVV